MSPYFYDAILVIIFLCAIGTGYKRGVLHTLLNIVCLVVAFAVASVMSTHEVTNRVYDEYLHSTVMEITEDAVNSAKEKAKEALLRNINEFAVSMVDEYFDGNEVMKEYALQIIADAEGKAGKGLSELFSYLGYDQRELLTNPVISGKIDKIVKEYSDNVAVEINQRLPLG
ncbi:MAG: CvpA family protein, partial [Oscillospiraceae bacterium]|nr:CvpA family protein [Oscillospiraceae bacterium]